MSQQPPTSEQLHEVSEHFLKVKEYKKELIKIIHHLKKQNIQERKHLCMILMVM